MSGASLKPATKRRLVAEKIIYDKGYKSLNEVYIDCLKYCADNQLDITFNKLAIQQFIAAQTNFSIKRLEVLCKILDVKDYSRFTEVFTAPKNRGKGELWIGTSGNTIKDLDLSTLADKL